MPAERGPTRVACTCGVGFTDVTANEAFARFHAHVTEKAEGDDLLHFQADVAIVQPEADLGPHDRVHVMSDDIARQLHIRNFGDVWTSLQEAELMKSMLFFTVEQTHLAFHLDAPDSTEDWKHCRRVTCTYVSVGLGERKEKTSG